MRKIFFIFLFGCIRGGFFSRFGDYLGSFTSNHLENVNELFVSFGFRDLFSNIELYQNVPNNFFGEDFSLLKFNVKYPKLRSQFKKETPYIAMFILLKDGKDLSEPQKKLLIFTFKMYRMSNYLHSLKNVSSIDLESFSKKIVSSLLSEERINNCQDLNCWYSLEKDFKKSFEEVCCKISKENNNNDKKVDEIITNYTQRIELFLKNENKNNGWIQSKNNNITDKESKMLLDLWNNLNSIEYKTNNFSSSSDFETPLHRVQNEAVTPYVIEFLDKSEENFNDIIYKLIVFDIKDIHFNDDNNEYDHLSDEYFIDDNMRFLSADSVIFFNDSITSKMIVESIKKYEQAKESLYFDEIRLLDIYAIFDILKNSDEEVNIVNHSIDEFQINIDESNDNLINVYNKINFDYCEYCNSNLAKEIGNLSEKMQNNDLSKEIRQFKVNEKNESISKNLIVYLKNKLKVYVEKFNETNKLINECSNYNSFNIIQRNDLNSKISDFPVIYKKDLELLEKRIRFILNDLQIIYQDDEFISCSNEAIKALSEISLFEQKINIVISCLDNLKKENYSADKFLDNLKENVQIMSKNIKHEKYILNLFHEHINNCVFNLPSFQSFIQPSSQSSMDEELKNLSNLKNNNKEFWKKFYLILDQDNSVVYDFEKMMIEQWRNKNFNNNQIKDREASIINSSNDLTPEEICINFLYSKKTAIIQIKDNFKTFKIDEEKLNKDLDYLVKDQKEDNKEYIKNYLLYKIKIQRSYNIHNDDIINGIQKILNFNKIFKYSSKEICQIIIDLNNLGKSEIMDKFINYRINEIKRKKNNLDFDNSHLNNMRKDIIDIMCDLKLMNKNLRIVDDKKKETYKRAIIILNILLALKRVGLFIYLIQVESLNNEYFLSEKSAQFLFQNSFPYNLVKLLSKFNVIFFSQLLASYRWRFFFEVLLSIDDRSIINDKEQESRYLEKKDKIWIDYDDLPLYKKLQEYNKKYYLKCEKEKLDYCDFFTIFDKKNLYIEEVLNKIDASSMDFQKYIIYFNEINIFKMCGEVLKFLRAASYFNNEDFNEKIKELDKYGVSFLLLVIEEKLNISDKGWSTKINSIELISELWLGINPEKLFDKNNKNDLFNLESTYTLNSMDKVFEIKDVLNNLSTQNISVNNIKNISSKISFLEIYEKHNTIYDNMRSNSNDIKICNQSSLYKSFELKILETLKTINYLEFFDLCFNLNIMLRKFKYVSLYLSFLSTESLRSCLVFRDIFAGAGDDNYKKLFGYYANVGISLFYKNCFSEISIMNLLFKFHCFVFFGYQFMNFSLFDYINAHLFIGIKMINFKKWQIVIGVNKNFDNIKFFSNIKNVNLV